MQIRDANYRQNALIVSVICGLMETFTISNYDNITIFVTCILSYYYLTHVLV